jgi:hypothetical protein
MPPLPWPLPVEGKPDRMAGFPRCLQASDTLTMTAIELSPAAQP